MTEKTIKICGQDIRMIYCAATENGYEDMSGKKISVFLPTFGKNENGETIVTEPAKATNKDFMMLAFAAIIAAYVSKGEEVPFDSDKFLYEASAEDVATLLTAIIELRADWYHISEVVNHIINKEAHEQPGDEQPKNAPAPTNDTADS